MPYQCDEFCAKAKEAEKANACLEEAWKELPGILFWIDKARSLAAPEARPQITAIYDAVEASMDGYEDVMDLLEKDRQDWLRHAAATDPFERHNI